MENKIIRWCKGCVCVEIQGNNKERFINLCTNNNIHIYDIEKNELAFRCYIDIDEYKKVKKIVRKTHIVPKIIEKIGLPFMYLKMQKRKSFVIGVMLGIFIFYICSLFIWGIGIDGDNYYTDYELKKYLKSIGITQGVLVKNIVCKDIEDAIRLEYKDIGWVSAQIEGTRLIINIKENIKYDVNNEGLQKDRNIIAPCSGIIRSIVVKNGEIKVGVGEEVKKGQILVSGVMEILDDAGEVIEKKGVKSEGDIVIEYDKEYYAHINRKRKERKYTGKDIKEYEFIYKQKNVHGRFSINFLKKFDNFDVIVNNYNVRVGEIFSLPLYVNEIIKREYKWVDKIYTDEELNKLAHKQFNIYSKKLENANIHIVHSSIDNYINDNMIISKGYVTVQSNDMEYKEITKEELVVPMKAKLDEN